MPIRWSSVPLAAVVAILLAACGSSKSSQTTSSAAGPAAPTSGAAAAARVRASSCMRSQGINIPDITPGRGQLQQAMRILGRYPSAKVQAALRACASQIREAFPNASGITPAQRAQRQRAGGVFATCMRSHGIAFPDPASATSDPSAYFRALGSLSVSSPAYRSAATACRAQALKAAGG